MRRCQGHDVGYGEIRDWDGRVLRHQPADCGKPVDVAFQEYVSYTVSSSRRRSKRHRGACLGVHDVPEVVFPRQAVENNASLSLSLGHAKTGYMMRSMRLLQTSSFRPSEGSDCCGPRVKRVVTRSDDKAEKDAVKLNEERGEVPSMEEGLDVDRLCGSTSRTRCQLVKLAKEFHCGDASSYP